MTHKPDKDCPTCGGCGIVTVDLPTGEYPYEDVCYTCGGSGQVEPSDDVNDEDVQQL